MFRFPLPSYAANGSPQHARNLRKSTLRARGGGGGAAEVGKVGTSMRSRVPAPARKARESSLSSWSYARAYERAHDCAHEARSVLGPGRIAGDEARKAALLENGAA